MKNFSIIALLMVLSYGSVAQTTANSKAPTRIQPIGINEAVPDVEISTIINFTTSKAKMSDFRGKLLILDFWATWCGPCISAFPKLDSLQREFGAAVQILSVTTEEEPTVQEFMKKMGKVNHLSPPTVVGDKTLSKLFRYVYLPHYVWINSVGKVVAITDDSEISRANIQGILNQKEYAGSVKNDLKLNKVLNDSKNGNPVFWPSIKLKADENVRLTEIPKSDLLIHSSLTKYVDGLPFGSHADSTLISAWNRSILSLYAIAFWHHSVDMLNPLKRVIDIPDSSLVAAITSIKDGKGLSGQHYIEWLKDFGYCYELKVPTSMKDQKFDMMLEDLNRYFGSLYGIEGVFEEREMPYLALRSNGSNSRLITAGGTPEVSKDHYSLKIKNQSANFLIRQMQSFLVSHPSIINETNIQSNIDLELNGQLSSLKVVNEELEKYGLYLIETRKLTQVAVIRMKASSKQ